MHEFLCYSGSVICLMLVFSITFFCINGRNNYWRNYLGSLFCFIKLVFLPAIILMGLVYFAVFLFLLA